MKIDFDSAGLPLSEKLEVSSSFICYAEYEVFSSAKTFKYLILSGESCQKIEIFREKDDCGRSQKYKVVKSEFYPKVDYLAAIRDLEAIGAFDFDQIVHSKIPQNTGYMIWIRDLNGRENYIEVPPGSFQPGILAKILYLIHNPFLDANHLLKDMLESKRPF